ncbi:PIG-L deacetylase family protein [Brevibacillus dissolubilis]|uniref:PIG-L deacetylase family protein n=1 Tax=Brevibacillus dissolubilis TaxID=1844116 RepID=UPI001116B947|nr:PIG-L family deacetylase [Brevibacillus dissolubilis]
MKKNLLFVFAHPDDETFTSGVTIAKYAQDDTCTITLLCATRGEAGKPGDPPICTQEELPQVREQELREACAILGIDNLELLDYKDKHLGDVPQPELAAHIIDAIRRHQPQVVVTFAPHGISGHPDHKAISAATSLALEQLAADENPVKKLYHATIPSIKPFTGQQGSQIFTDPPESITTEIVEPDHVETAALALLAHHTQHVSVERVFPGISHGDYSNVRSINYFILVWHNMHGTNASSGEKERDFFAGIV